MDKEFFKVKVEFSSSIDDKAKTVKKTYITEAYSVSDAEATTVAYLTDKKEENFEVVSISTASIADVIRVM